MLGTIIRRAQFAASYRYWLPDLDSAANLARFGSKARSPGGRFDLQFWIQGPVGRDGMVANLSTTVKRKIMREIVQPLDGSYLNEVWPELARSPLPTPETLARVIWHRIQPHLNTVQVRVAPASDRWVDYFGQAQTFGNTLDPTLESPSKFLAKPTPELTPKSTSELTPELKPEPTPKSTSELTPELKPEPTMDVLLTVRVEFCASHRLALPELTLAQNSEIYGKCARPNGHGHNYWLAVTVRGRIDPRTGMAVDLDRLHALVKNWVDEELDHLYLNLDIPYFAEVVPTAENIAVYICDRLRSPIRDLGVELYKIQLDETDNNACEVYASTLDAAAPRLGIQTAAL